MLSSFFPFAFNTNILTLDVFIIEIKIVSAELELNYSIGEKRQHIKNLKTYIVIFNSYLKLTKPELFIKLFPLFAGNKSREIIPLLHNHFITIAHHQYQSMVTPLLQESKYLWKAARLLCTNSGSWNLPSGVPC